MPGILLHLAFANIIEEKIGDRLSFNKTDFFAGNLIPDLAKDKKSAHYSIKASQEGFCIPDMKQVSQNLLDITNPIKLGMYSHLYLDYHFIEEFLIPEFRWIEGKVKNPTTNEEKLEIVKVVNPKNGKEWNASTFFSNEGMYGAYTEINHLLIRDGYIPFSIIEQIPNILPNSGLPVFDVRRKKTWREELREYLSEKKEYTGEVFEYERLWNFIEKISEQFINEVFVN